MPSKKKLICIFDVDGTLTPPRQVISPEMQTFMTNEIKPLCTIGLVGGSDLSKIAEQIGGFQAVNQYDYVFAENGLIALKDGQEIGRESIKEFMGEAALQRFINFALHYMSELTLPVKRGTFVEFRTGLLNICPVGRSCSQEEREQFEVYDRENRVRETFIEAIKAAFPNIGLTYSIGGQISFDVFPTGWDKTKCLRYINHFEEIHFFGDKTDPGGNDHEIYIDPRVIGHKVTSPEDTMNQLRMFFKLQ